MEDHYMIRYNMSQGGDLQRWGTARLACICELAVAQAAIVAPAYNWLDMIASEDLRRKPLTRRYPR